MPHRNTLRVHRKQWALSQTDLAHLLGLRARSVVSDYELGAEMPNVRVALAYQLVFGVSLKVLFPDLADEVEDDIIRRAAQLDAKLRHRTDADAAQAAKLLREMISRVGNADAI